jgi:hypothetical protein
MKKIPGSHGKIPCEYKYLLPIPLPLTVRPARMIHDEPDLITVRSLDHLGISVQFTAVRWWCSGGPGADTESFMSTHCYQYMINVNNPG